MFVQKYKIDLILDLVFIILRPFLHTMIMNHDKLILIDKMFILP